MNEYDGKEGKPPRRSVEQILRDSLPHPVRCAVVFLHTETFTRSFDFFFVYYLQYSKLTVLVIL